MAALNAPIPLSSVPTAIATLRAVAKLAVRFLVLLLGIGAGLSDDAHALQFLSDTSCDKYLWLMTISPSRVEPIPQI